MSPEETYVILLVAGLMLIGAEIFMPGGILGTFGGLALFAAIIVGYRQFGPVAGSYSALGIVVMVGVVMILWIKVFPRTSIGKSMAVSRELTDAKATESGLDGLVGKRGQAVSDLRPAGFATIDGRRVDVVTQGGRIAGGTPVEVLGVESNRVIVGKIEEEA